MLLGVIQLRRKVSGSMADGEQTERKGGGTTGRRRQGTVDDASVMVRNGSIKWLQDCVSSTDMSSLSFSSPLLNEG